MDIQQLQYFQKLAVIQHMTRASEELNITQPALSSSISRLENELGLQLFDRNKRQLILNENGRIFQSHVDDILKHYTYALEELQHQQEQQNSTLSLLISGTGFPKKIIKGFCSKYPNINIRQEYVLADQLKSLPLRQNMDFLLTAYPVDLEDCEQLKIYEESFYIAVPKAHPFASFDSIRIEDLINETFVCLPKGHLFRSMCESMCHKAGFMPNVVVECYPPQIAELLEDTANVAFTIESSMRSNEFGPNIRLIPISTPGCSREISLCYRKNLVFSKSAKLFYRYCQEYKECLDS